MAKDLRIGKRNDLIFYIMLVVLPIIQFIVFYVYVNFSSIIMAFQEFVGYDDKFKAVYSWGFGNFQKFWQEMTDVSTGYSQDFRDSLKNTLFFFFFGNLFSIPI